MSAFSNKARPHFQQIYNSIHELEMLAEAKEAPPELEIALRELHKVALRARSTSFYTHS